MPSDIFTQAEQADAECRLVFGHSPDGTRWVVRPDDARLEGVAVQPFQPDVVGAVHAHFDTRVVAGLPVAGRAGGVALDPDSRRELTSAAVMATLDAWPAGGFWRLSDNTNLPLDRAEIVALGKAAAAYYQVLFATRSALLDAIAAGVPIDPEQGWPTPPAFDPAG